MPDGVVNILAHFHLERLRVKVRIKFVYFGLNFNQLVAENVSFKLRRLILIERIQILDALSADGRDRLIDEALKRYSFVLLVILVLHRLTWHVAADVVLTGALQPERLCGRIDSPAIFFGFLRCC